MNMQKKAELLAVGERYLNLLEFRCEEAVFDGRYFLAELWENEYSGAVGMLEALGLISHMDALKRFEALTAWRLDKKPALAACPEKGA